MMIDQLYELYFGWLYSQIDIKFRRNSMIPYTQLFKMFHDKEFVWIVPNDDNRLEDGKELRLYFLQEEKVPKDCDLQAFENRPCSMLEVLIALSRRLGFQTDTEPSWWAWKLIENLELDKMKDPLSAKKQVMVDEALEALIWRTYKWDGVGGFFPLAFPKGDQTKVEIWYQMHAYIQEGHTNS